MGKAASLAAVSATASIPSAALIILDCWYEAVNGPPPDKSRLANPTAAVITASNPGRIIKRIFSCVECRRNGVENKWRTKLL